MRNCPDCKDEKQILKEMDVINDRHKPGSRGYQLKQDLDMDYWNRKLDEDKRAQCKL